MFSTGELTRLRATSERSLSDTCTLRRAGASVRDAGGGSTTTYTDVELDCFVFPSGGQWVEQLVGSRLAGISEHFFKFAVDTVVGQRDRIVWQTRTYEVTGIVRRSDGLLLIIGAKGTS